MTPELPDLPDDSSRPEVIISAALYLMSSYGCGGGCPKLAHVILRHLHVLAGRTDVQPVIRSTCAQLADQWEFKLSTLLPERAAPRRAATLLPFARRLVH